jgi:GNAT superfamily N-acetyltransferase
MNDSSIRLQQIFADEAQLLSEVAIKAYSDHYLNLWYDDGAWYIDKYFSVPVLRQELLDDNALFFLVYHKDSPTGFLKINADAALDDVAKEQALELERIYLNKNASGKGIGSYILSFIFDIARSKNKKIIWLKVMDSSEAVSFYKQHGFEICGTHHLDLKQMKQELRGMFVMKKYL